MTLSKSVIYYMGKLDELRAMIGEQFEKADATMKTKDYIDYYSKVNSLLDSAIKENETLVENNAELSKSYKDLVLHTSTGSEQPKTLPGETGEAPNFEEMLNAFANK